jgi:hypothetical protein
MKIPLLCHWNGDGDIAAAFLQYYTKWVSQFYFIIHGTEEENRTILDLSKDFPVIIHSSYTDRFDEAEKTRRLNELAQKFSGEWLLLVDSDEFVELPYDSLEETVSSLEDLSSVCMAAPMLQRFRADRSLNSPEVVINISDEFPMCSEQLYELMGGAPTTSKFPLFRCTPTSVIGFGNHFPQKRLNSQDNEISGVTHHFKWRRSVISRINDRIEEGWPWSAVEAIPYLRYLEANNFKLPATGSFQYSRCELFERKLLRRARFCTLHQFLVERRFLERAS